MTEERKSPCACGNCDFWAPPGKLYWKDHRKKVFGPPQVLVKCACGLCEELIAPEKMSNGGTRRFVKGHQGKKHGAPQMILCACGCGTLCADRDDHKNPRKYVPGHGYRMLRKTHRKHPVSMTLTDEEKQWLEEKSDGKRPLGQVLREQFFQNVDLGLPSDEPQPEGDLDCDHGSGV